MKTLDIHQILNKLPHRYPFLLVDRVLDIDTEGNKIRAIKNVSINEPFFGGHFPKRPVMPGVLILESMAQASLLLAFASLDLGVEDDHVYYFVGVDGARFKRPVEPGDQLVLEMNLDRVKAGIFKFSGRAMVGGEVACEASLMCTKRKVG